MPSASQPGPEKIIEDFASSSRKRRVVMESAAGVSQPVAPPAPKLGRGRGRPPSAEQRPGRIVVASALTSSSSVPRPASPRRKVVTTASCPSSTSTTSSAASVNSTTPTNPISSGPSRTGDCISKTTTATTTTPTTTTVAIRPSSAVAVRRVLPSPSLENVTFVPNVRSSTGPRDFWLPPDTLLTRDSARRIVEDLESGRQLIPFDPAKFFRRFLGLEESGYDGAEIKPEEFKPWSVS